MVTSRYTSEATTLSTPPTAPMRRTTRLTDAEVEPADTATWTWSPQVPSLITETFNTSVEALSWSVRAAGFAVLDVTRTTQAVEPPLTKNAMIACPAGIAGSTGPNVRRNSSTLVTRVATPTGPSRKMSMNAVSDVLTPAIGWTPLGTSWR